MSIPLAPAVFPLIYLGYPPKTVCTTLRCHFFSNDVKIFRRWSSFETFEEFTQVLDITTTEDLASIRHSVYMSPTHIAAAAYTMLSYLINHVGRPGIPTYSAHKSWLQRMKPGKHVATGSPRLASVIHAQWLVLLRQHPRHIWQLRKLESISMALQLQRHITQRMLRKWRNQHEMIIRLLDALLWVLPKASFSDKILLYSKRAFPWYQSEPGLARRARKYLDRHTNRVLGAKLEDLGRRIADGEYSGLFLPDICSDIA